LTSRQFTLNAADFDYLISRLDPKVEADLKLVAGQILSRSDFSDGQLIAIASTHLKAADPLVLPNLLDAFRNNRSETVGMALVKALPGVEAALGPIGGQRAEEIVKKFPASVQEEAKPLIARIEAGRKERLGKLKKLESVISKAGDVAVGRTIFFGAKAGCGSCHTIGTEGGNVGPDLTSIGAIRSPHDLLEAIVLPSESFVPGHEVYRVETDREIYSGVLKNRGRGGDVVILVTGPNDEVRILRKDVKKMGLAPISLMPEGFDDVLSVREMTDLMAFLRAQTARPSGSSQGAP
jgi:putative heme-binding domain-containing protein